MALELGHEWIDWERERVRALSVALRRWVAPLLLGAAVSGLFLVALRGNILQMRYQLDAVYREESALVKRKAEVTARYWQLRSPGALEREATGKFVIPRCVVRVRPDGSRSDAGCTR
jgi:hypothetical protein